MRLSKDLKKDTEVDMNMNDRTIKVSVVIPVYNVEKYIRQCLDSLLIQTLSEFEIICVDDGSKDNSYNILCEYASKDKRIKILTQNNLYAGVARNEGLKIAKGKYVIFLDSDDFFHPRMLEELYNKAELLNAQIVVFGYSVYNDKTKRITQVPYRVKHTKLVSSKELGKDIFSVCGAIPWNKLLLREYVDSQKLEYQAIMNNNDEYFNRMIVVAAERIYFYNRRFVNYRVNNANSLQGGLKKNVLCFGEALKAIYTELNKRRVFDGNIKSSFVDYAERLIIENLSRASNYEDFQSIFRFLKNDVIPHLLSNQNSFDNSDIMNKIISTDSCQEFV